jgi:C-terminal processing protease CtpA/Prc
VSKRALWVLVFLCSPVCHAQHADVPPDSPRLHLQDALSFEAPPTGSLPGGWGGAPRERLFSDGEVVHSGKRAARLERPAGGSDPVTVLTMAIPMDFSGKEIELRGFLKLRDVAGGYVGLWMREDGDVSNIALENMQTQAVAGTRDWGEYSIRLRFAEAGRRLLFGVLLTGSGTVWADDLQLLVDGKPVSLAPARPLAVSVFEQDHEFDAGSGIFIEHLSKTQVANLTMLGKVWGFLKYHHPSVTSGRYHWDYELFRSLPKVLAAETRADARAVLAAWVSKLGPLPSCDDMECASLDVADIHLEPQLAWLHDERMLGSTLSRALLEVYAHRRRGEQFYVSSAPNINNPVFEREMSYPAMKPGDAGLQLLALYRYWNIVEYWFPYRDVIGTNWDAVLERFVPRLALAKSRQDYVLSLFALIAQVNESHSGLFNAVDMRPPVGACRIGVKLRFVGHDPVVTGLLPGAEGNHALERGDVLESINGVSISKRVKDWSPYYGASNDAGRFRDIAGSMTRGECGPVPVQVRRGGKKLTVTATRARLARDPEETRHDLPGDTFRRLTDRIAYLKLSTVRASDIAGYIESAADTDGMIVDIRNYPSDFVVFALGQLLVDESTSFVRFTKMDISNPGASHWATQIQLQPRAPHYAGKVIVLVDETSQSQAEYTAMALRASKRTRIVGSMTAGADGNISLFQLPGGLNTAISGLGVFYPDRAPTQRVGIVPDVVVTPTVAGIRAGRDEVLEAAQKLIEQ